MINDELLKKRWNLVKDQIAHHFNDSDTMDIEGILYLIGIQEIGLLKKKYKKQEKMELIHVAICTVLEPYGFYKREGADKDGWPHFQLLSELPFLKPGEQSLLMKEAIVNYFLELEVID